MHAVLFQLLRLTLKVDTVLTCTIVIVIKISYDELTDVYGTKDELKVACDAKYELTYTCGTKDELTDTCRTEYELTYTCGAKYELTDTCGT